MSNNGVEYSYREEWMSDDQYECFQMLAALCGGFHHLEKVKPFGLGVEMNTSQDLSTFDFNTLTRAVFMAHDRAIRFGVRASGPGRVKVVLHKRKREGSMSERHPTLDEALAEYRHGRQS